MAASYEYIILIKNKQRRRKKNGFRLFLYFTVHSALLLLLFVRSLFYLSIRCTNYERNAKKKKKTNKNTRHTSNCVQIQTYNFI